MILTRDTLIEGKVYPSGTTYELKESYGDLIEISLEEAKSKVDEYLRISTQTTSRGSWSTGLGEESIENHTLRGNISVFKFGVGSHVRFDWSGVVSCKYLDLGSEANLYIDFKDFAIILSK